MAILVITAALVIVVMMLVINILVENIFSDRNDFELIIEYWVAVCVTMFSK